MQKTEDRTRELRKKGAAIKRPVQTWEGENKEEKWGTLPEKPKRRQGWAPRPRHTRQRPPRSFVPGSTRKEERKGVGEATGLAWRDAARALLEGAPGSVPAARSSLSPPPSCTEPALRDRGEVSRKSRVLFQTVPAGLRGGEEWSPNFGAPGLLPHLILHRPSSGTVNERLSPPQSF